MHEMAPVPAEVPPVDLNAELPAPIEAVAGVAAGTVPEVEVAPVSVSAASAAPETTPVFEHKHGNGEVRAGTVEQARRQCPALGKLSVEQAGLLLKLQAIGKQKMSEKKTAEQDEPKRKAQAHPDKPEAAAPTTVNKTEKPAKTVEPAPRA
jgi:hypothetical protein